MTTRLRLSLLLLAGALVGVPTNAMALDICDELGLSGLTISSDTNCLQISGGVSYEFTWGDYEGGLTDPPEGAVFVDPHSNTFTIPQPGAGFGGGELDWASKVEAWIRFVATEDSDVGPARAVIKILEVQDRDSWGYPPAPIVIDGPDNTNGLTIDEAYVSIGDSTVLTAGKKGTIIYTGDDRPFNFLGLFNSDGIDGGGVKWTDGILEEGGVVIQVESDLGNNLTGFGALEGINTTFPTGFAGLKYKTDDIRAHVTIGAGGILSGPSTFGIHTGVTADFDPFSLRAAIAADSTGYFNTLASIKTTYDIYKLAASVEYSEGGDFGAGASLKARITDDIKVNVGSRFFYDGSGGPSGGQIATQVIADLTETLELSAEIGWLVNDIGTSVIYGDAGLKWRPGGNFKASVNAAGYSNGAYKLSAVLGKSFGDDGRRRGFWDAQ